MGGLVRSVGRCSYRIHPTGSVSSRRSTEGFSRRSTGRPQEPAALPPIRNLRVVAQPTRLHRPADVDLHLIRQSRRRPNPLVAESGGRHGGRFVLRPRTALWLGRVDGCRRVPRGYRLADGDLGIFRATVDVPAGCNRRHLGPTGTRFPHLAQWGVVPRDTRPRGDAPGYRLIHLQPSEARCSDRENNVAHSDADGRGKGNRWLSPWPTRCPPVTCALSTG